MMQTGTYPVLSESAWRARKAAHRDILMPILEPQLARRSRGESHAVMDFLFEYYSFSPSNLLRWTPAWGIALDGAVAEFAGFAGFQALENGAVLPAETFPTHRRKGLAWVIGLLEQCAARPPRLGCFGLHEWAMVYNPSDIRHRSLPLRVEHGVVRKLVETGPLTCSHYDAFRFFSRDAAPLNRLPLTRIQQAEFEQPGCLHANMDLYKWSYKFFPFLPAELTAECFLLAVSARELDMRASPYDVSCFGLEPICIETDEGKTAYRIEQEALTRRSAPIRMKLLDELHRLQQAL